MALPAVAAGVTAGARSIWPFLQKLFGPAMLAMMGYQMGTGIYGTKKQLGLQQKSLEMEDQYKQEEIKAAKEMNNQKQSMTEKYMAAADRESAKNRELQMMQMRLAMMQSRDAMVTQAMGNIGGAISNLGPDPRYISSLIQ